MTRKNKDFTRDCPPDLKYQNTDITKFINQIMKDGKKNLAKNIFYSALEKVSEKVNKTPVETFQAALGNVVPLMEVKPRRVGGSTYQVPMEVPAKRGKALAMRWIIKNANSRSGRSIADKLAAELLDAFNREGSSIKKREDSHKMAEANKAFAHFRW